MTHFIRVVRCAMFAFAVAVCGAVPFHSTVAMPYRLLLDSNADAGSGQEVFAVTFDTFEDFINATDDFDGEFSGIDINSAFDVVGFAAEYPLRQTQVPEPGMLFLFGLGLLSIVAVRRRQ